jgi:hypothetical protein
LRKNIFRIIAICLIGVVLIVGMNFKSISNAFSDKFWQVIAKQFDKETKDDSKLQYGRIGKDTIMVLGDGKFHIGKFDDDKVFYMYNENQTLESLLRKVSKFKESKGLLYVVSDEGYGIADSKTNKCKLFITSLEQEYTSGHITDSEGIQYSISRFSDDEHIEYLESYDAFSSEEQKVFEEMK